VNVEFSVQPIFSAFIFIYAIESFKSVTGIFRTVIGNFKTVTGSFKIDTAKTTTAIDKISVPPAKIKIRVDIKPNALVM